MPINFNGQNLTQWKTVTWQDICDSHLSVNELVAELRKEEFGMFLSHLMEIFTYLGIQSHSSVIVNCELLFARILTLNGHSPSVQKLSLTQFVVLFQQVSNINLFLTSSPSQTSW